MQPWNKVWAALQKSFRTAINRLSQIKPSQIKRVAMFSGISLVLIAGTWMLFRNQLLAWGLERIQEKAEHRNMRVEWKSASFCSWQEVQFENLTCYPLVDRGKVDTLLTARRLSLGLRWWTFWNLGLSSFETQDLHINLVQDSNGRSNYQALLASNSQQESSESAQDPVSAIAETTLRYLGKAPNHLRMMNSRLEWHSTQQNWVVMIPKALMDGENFTSQISGREKGSLWGSFSISGQLNKRHLMGSQLRVSPYSNKFTQVEWRKPFESWGFRSASFSVEDLEVDEDGVNLELNSEITAPFLRDVRISDTVVSVKQMKSRLFLNLNAEQIKLDSQTSIQVENLNFHCYGQYGFKRPLYALGLHIPQTEAQRLFDALPAGLFRNMGPFAVQGELEYRFHLALDGQKPDSCQLFSRMYPSADFKVKHWGYLNPQRLNRPFTYEFYDLGRLTKQFTVGPDWEGYCLLNEVSPKLVACILKSEDPSFFQHRGFVPDAFRSSLATNYKEKRFKRGASTLSMQLVKNLFLGRRKTIARKAEEILITWLLEREHVVNKTRMMEIYLNIVEWGPGLFGAKQASQFYFGKHPLDLSWGESAFLASIIPRPKKVYYTLNDQGCASESFSHPGFLLRLMKERDPSLAIDSSDYRVCLQPIAYQSLAAMHGHIAPQDSLDLDSD